MTATDDLIRRSRSDIEALAGRPLTDTEIRSITRIVDDRLSDALYDAVQSVAGINEPDIDEMLEAVPEDWPVTPVDPDFADHVPHGALAICGTCGLGWDDTRITSMTPAPSARCPFEPFHP